MNIPASVIVVGTGCTPSTASLWVNFINEACQKFGITDPMAVSAFLANAGVETGGLNQMSESMSYSAARMAAVWPSRYALPLTAEQAKQTSPVRSPNALALSLANNPKALANNVYANRLGNGDASTNNGWDYRGGGIFQLTGLANWTRCAKAIGIDIVGDNTLLREPGAPAADSAAWFFADKGCIQAAVSGNFSRVVQLINGQPPCPENKGALRQSRYLACKAAISAL